MTEYKLPGNNVLSFTLEDGDGKLFRNISKFVPIFSA